jgi:hypothetical protein
MRMCMYLERVPLSEPFLHMTLPRECCVCVHVHVSACVRVCICVYVFVYVCECVTRAGVKRCVRACVGVRAFVFVYAFPFALRDCMCVFVYICLHFTHAHIHTYIHTCTYRNLVECEALCAITRRCSWFAYCPDHREPGIPVTHVPTDCNLVSYG